MRNQWVATALTSAVMLATGACGVSAATLTRGIELDFAYIQDYFHVVNGGLDHGNGTPGAVDISARISGASWGGSDDDLFYVDVLGTLGNSISEDAGDLQVLDNIEAFNTVKLFSAWYEHRFAATGFRLRVGLQDYNALFDVLDSAAVFINSSFGLDPTIAQANVTTFPVTSVGGVASWQGPKGVYAMIGVYDGVPGRPGHPAGTHIVFHDSDGVFSALETGLAGGGDRPYKIALGGWYRTSDFVDPTSPSGENAPDVGTPTPGASPAGRMRDGNYGVYVIGEARLVGGADRAPAVDGFFQFGAAEAGRNILDRYIGAGLAVTGLLPGRADDVLGLGMARAQISGDYRRIAANASDAETAVEVTYQAPINDYLAIQPDVQYIVDPGADRAIDNALVIGARALIAF